MDKKQPILQRKKHYITAVFEGYYEALCGFRFARSPRTRGRGSFKQLASEEVIAREIGEVTCARCLQKLRKAGLAT